MDLASLTILQAMKGNMRYLGQKQAVIANNISNANTPEHKAETIERPSFQALLAGKGGKLQLHTTSAGHLQGSNAKHINNHKISLLKTDVEVKPNGNNVSLEEQSLHMASTSNQYQSTSNAYRKVMDMLRTAINNSGQQ